MTKIAVCKSEKVIPRMAGSMLVTKVRSKARVFSDMENVLQRTRGPKPVFSDGKVLMAAAVSLSAGNPDFVDVEEFRNAPAFYGSFLGAKGMLPSESTVRQRLDAMGSVFAEDEFQAFWKANYDLLTKFKPRLGQVQVQNEFLTPVDLDVTIFDNTGSHKEGVMDTYKHGVKGFVPMATYIGIRGIALAVEMRIGKQHSQTAPPDMLRKMLEFGLAVTDGKLLFRYDSGNDDRKNMQIINDCDRAKFVGKHNFRRTDQHAEALRLIQSATRVESPRHGKRVYTGSTAKVFEYQDAEGNVIDTMTMRAVF